MKRNIVLIVLDTVRQDYFEEYAPRLRSASDVSFEQCRAASSCSVPSHASMMTGQLPHRHGIHSFAVDYSGLGESNTFLGDLPDHRSIGVSANTFAGSPFGFDKMFDEFADISWTRRFPDGMDAREFVTLSDATGLDFYRDFFETAISHDYPLRTMGNAALAQLDMVFSRLPFPKVLDDGASAVLKTALDRANGSSEPFFTLINLMDAHTPHQPIRQYDRSIGHVPSDWSSLGDLNQWEISRHGIDGHEESVENFRRLYAASIEYLDRQVASFVRRLRASTDRETTVVLTADHGENLGYPADDGLFGHNSSLSEGLLHVPLALINPPDGYAARETDYVSQIELGTLVAGIAHGRTPDVFAERIAAERIGTTNVPAVDDGEQAYWRRMLRCAYEGDSKFVWDSFDECIKYELDPTKPCWQRPMAGENAVVPPSWATAFFDGEIAAYERESGGADGTLERYTDVTDATRSRLEELGYL